MKLYKLTNISKFDFQISANTVTGNPGVIYTLKSGESVTLHESQLSGDLSLKIRKKLISIVETERETVKSSFKNGNVELEKQDKPPLSTRGRKKKLN